MSPCFTSEGCVAGIYIYTAVQAAYVEPSGSVDETGRPRDQHCFSSTGLGYILTDS